MGTGNNYLFHGLWPVSYTHLVVAGSADMSGAAYLCAKAAYSMGAGLVKIMTPQENRQILQTLLPEAILSSYRNGQEPENLEKLRCV